MEVIGLKPERTLLRASEPSTPQVHPQWVLRHTPQALRSNPSSTHMQTYHTILTHTETPNTLIHVNIPDTHLHMQIPTQTCHTLICINRRHSCTFQNTHNVFRCIDVPHTIPSPRQSSTATIKSRVPCSFLSLGCSGAGFLSVPPVLGS